MTDPRRLADVGSPFQQALLRSARRDHGSHSAEARCIVAVSTVAATAAHASGAAAVHAAAANAAAANIANAALGTGAGAGVGAASAAASVGFVAKAVAVGLALGLSVQGAAVVHRNVSKPNTAHSGNALSRASAETRPSVTPGESANRAQPREVTETASSAAPAVTTTATPTALPNDDRRATERAPFAVVRTGSPSTQRAREAIAPENTPERDGVSPSTRSADSVGVLHVPTNDALEREVALIDEARLACRARDYSQALTLLDRHQQQFALGSLGPEALVIRVQALVGLGRRAEAERLAQPYLANYGSSPITQRLRSILGK